MLLSDPDVSRPRLIRDARFLEADRRETALRRGRHNRLGFAYLVTFVRVLGRWKNVILYGEIKIDPAMFKMRAPYSVFIPDQVRIRMAIQMDAPLPWNQSAKVVAAGMSEGSIVMSREGKSEIPVESNKA